MTALVPEAVESLIGKVGTLDLTDHEQVVLDILLERAAGSPEPSPEAPEGKFLLAQPEWTAALGLDQPESKFMH